jgi:molecular chaperone GrpE
MAEPREQRAGYGEPAESDGAPEGAGAGESPPAPTEDRPSDPSQYERVAELEAERDDYLRDLQRVAADFDNFRKRATREQESLVARAHERLMKALLPVLDDLERALEAAASHEEAQLEEGVRLVARELRAALEREGLEEIATEGAFDPHVHEALLSQPSEVEEGTVIEVLQRGYRLGGRVLRPARVVISQGQAQETAQES